MLYKCVRVQEEEEGRCIQSNPLDHSTSLYIRGSPGFIKKNTQVPGYRTNEFVSEAIVMNSSYGTVYLIGTSTVLYIVISWSRAAPRHPLACCAAGCAGCYGCCLHRCNVATSSGDRCRYSSHYSPAAARSRQRSKALTLSRPCVAKSMSSHLSTTARRTHRRIIHGARAAVADV